MFAEKLKIVDLPSMPQVVARIMQIDDSQIQLSVDEIKTIVQSDPALSTKILKLANSAFYGRGNRINNLGQAIALLGFKTVKGLSLLVSAAAIVPRNGNPRILKEFWMRSVLSALIAKIIAEKVGKEKFKDEIFIIGLLRHIGRLILANQYPDEYAICFEMSSAAVDAEKLHQLEKMKWGFTSSEVTAYAMEKWNFPQEWVEAGKIIRYKLKDIQAIEQSMPLVLPVILAEYIVHLGGYTEYFPLDEKLRPKLMQEFEQICPVYQIDTAKKDYYLKDLRQIIKEDSFYSFCGELFSN